nr:lanthionine synthetase LanC family protein [Bacillus licheniformis]MDH3162034.1 lanthionine synthetase LanC family protein [Bacillus licheniformis]
MFDSQSLKKIISQCLAFEKRLYIASEKNWGSKGREQLSVAWCHGGRRHIVVEKHPPRKRSQ